MHFVRDNYNNELSDNLLFIDWVFVVYLVSVNIHVVSAQFNAIMQNVAYLIFIAYYLIRNKMKISISFYSVQYGLFLVWAGCSVLWTASVSDTLSLFRILLKVYVLLIFISSYYSEEEKCERFWKSVYCALIFVILYTVITTPIEDWVRQYVGKRLGMDTVRFAMRSMLCACIAFFFWNRTRRVKYMVVMIMTSAVSLLTGKRTGLIFFACFICIFLLVMQHNWYKKIVAMLKISCLAIVLLVLIYNVPVLYNTVGVRIDDLFNTLSNNSGTDVSAIHRMMLMEHAWQSFLEKPLFGHGLNTQRYLLQLKNFIQITYAHNNFLEVASGLGLIGFFLYYSLYIRAITNCFLSEYKYTKPFCALVLALLISYLVCDFVQVIYESYFEIIIIAILFTMSFQDKNKARRI